MSLPLQSSLHNFFHNCFASSSSSFSLFAPLCSENSTGRKLKRIWGEKKKVAEEVGCLGYTLCLSHQTTRLDTLFAHVRNLIHALHDSVNAHKLYLLKELFTMLTKQNKNKQKNKKQKKKEERKRGTAYINFLY